MKLRACKAGLERPLSGALVLAAVAALACETSHDAGAGNGGSGGAPTCASGVSCMRIEDCPGVSCVCPGVRFPVTIQQCSGRCCATTCEEACPSSGGGSGGAAGSGGSGGAVECPTGTYDIDVDWMTPYAAGVAFAGEISLPANVTAGRATELSIEKAGPDAGGTQLVTSFVTQAGVTSLTYRISLIQDGNYYVSFLVDEGGNGSFGDSGDLVGFYNGTLAMPIASKADAPLVVVRSACQVDRDFAVGVVP